MPAVPYSATGKAPDDTPWSWDASTQNAILGENGDDWAAYKRAHAYWDGTQDADAEAKSHYKLPHHRQGSSGLETVWHGVANAMARLSSTDMPDDERQATHEHLAKHYKQFGQEPPEYERILAMVAERHTREQRALTLPRNNDGAVMVATRAAISIEVARPGGQPTDDDMTFINAMARSPMRAEQVYVVPAEISNQSIDAYYTRMLPETLARFAERASSGIAFCDSHEHGRLPIGRSFYGDTAMVDHDGTAMMSARAMVYMLRGVQTSSGMRTDDIIAGMEGGVYNDVSVGFIPLRYWCSVCGADMLRTFECMHWPGQTYTVRDDKTGKESEVLCVADVDADLAEFSLVYDGATPNAMLLKAQREIEAGRATARLITFVEDRCRVKLSERYRGFGSGTQQVSAPAAPRALPAPAPAQTPGQEDEEMRGSEFVRGVIAEAERAGKAISSANMDRLMTICNDLESGHGQAGEAHDTMGNAMRSLADFLSEHSTPAEADGETEGQGASEQEGDEQPARSAPEAGQGTSAERAKKGGKTSADEHDDNADGTNKPPKSEAGAGDAGDPDNKGADEHGVDEADAKDPEQPTEPGGDDGDGDEDEPTHGEESDAEDSEQGSPKSGKSKKRSSTARSAPEGAAALPAEAQRAMAFYTRAKEQAVTEALAAGARALGQGFQPEAYRALFAVADIDQVQRFRDDWQALAKSALSPRGQFVPEPGKPGGGHWTSEPTEEGGRQTQARDPNDPAGAIPGGARLAGQQAAGQWGGVSGDLSLYTVGRKRGR